MLKSQIYQECDILCDTPDHRPGRRDKAQVFCRDHKEQTEGSATVCLVASYWGRFWNKIVHLTLYKNKLNDLYSGYL